MKGRDLSPPSYGSGGLVEALTCGLLPPAAERRFAVTIKTYFDDSGSHVGSPVCVLAGPVARVRKWHKLTKAWWRELTAEPQIAYFKASEAASLTGEFDNWTPEAVAKKIRKLAQVIQFQTDAHLVVAIRGDEYDAIVRGRIADDWDSPYLPCFYHALGCACKYMHENAPGDRLLPIFDEQPDYEKEAEILHNLLRDAPDKIRELNPGYIYNKYLGRCHWGDDRLDVGIQAADLIAWHYRIEAIGEWSNKQTGELLSRLGRLPVIGSVWGAPQLQGWVSGLPKVIDGTFRDSFTAPDPNG